jgi:RNA polymerase sigma-70 factor, ECF subfamily
MAAPLFSRNPHKSVRGELCLEPEGILLVQENETEEQKVTRIFQELRLPVYYYLMAFLGNAATADDLTQEVFLRLYAHLHRGRAVDNVRLWAFRVAHNLAFCERQQYQRLARLDELTWNDVCARLPDPALNPEQSTLQHERMERLHAAIQSLSAQERQCLLLRAEGLRYREIGKILGVGTSTVGEFLQRAMRKLVKINPGK